MLIEKGRLMRAAATGGSGRAHRPERTGVAVRLGRDQPLAPGLELRSARRPDLLGQAPDGHVVAAALGRLDQERAIALLDPVPRVLGERAAGGELGGLSPLIVELAA